MSVEAEITGELEWFRNEDKLLVFSCDGDTSAMDLWELEWDLALLPGGDSIITKLSPDDIGIDPDEHTVTVTIVAADTAPLPPGQYFHRLLRLDIPSVLSYGPVDLLYA